MRQWFVALTAWACQSEPAPRAVPADEIACPVLLTPEIVFPDTLRGGRGETVATAIWSVQAGESEQCARELRLLSLTLDPPVPHFRIGPVDRALAPRGETMQATVSWIPANIGPQGATVVATFDGAAEPLTTEIHGVATGPRMAVPTAPVRLATQTVGCSATHSFTVRNTGTTPLHVTDIQAALDPGWTVWTDPPRPPTGWSLDPELPGVGPLIKVYATWRSLTPASGTARVVIISDDPSLPTAEVEIRAASTADGQVVDDRILSPAPVDIVWTVERTGRARDQIARLTREIQVFFDGVLSQSDPRVAVVVQDNGCVLGDKPWIDRTFSSSEAAATFATMADLDFKLGGYGSNTEYPFFILDAALATTASGKCSDDLLREDAAFSAVLLTASSGYPYLSALESMWKLKGDRGLATVSAIAGTSPDPCARVSFFDPGRDAVRLTGGTLWSICDPPETTLADAAKTLSDPPRTFQVPRPGIIETLQVDVDGRDITDRAYLYDGLELVIQGQSGLRAGQVLRTRYTPTEVCASDE